MFLSNKFKSDPYLMLGFKRDLKLFQFSFFKRNQKSEREF